MNIIDILNLGFRLMKRERIGLSIDITDRCTLNCMTCYMKWYGKKDDLSLDRWIEIIENIPKEERIICAWTGGEPFLRIDDIKELTKFFKWNWIATNGTLPIERIPKTTILISVDGTKEVHNKIRGGWDDIVNNAIRDSYIAYNITKINSSKNILEETIEFWRDRVKGIIYSFYTPKKGEYKHSNLYQNTEEKMDVIGYISDLKEIYGDFIVNTVEQLYYCVKIDWSQDCPASKTMLALDAQGNVKKPCVLGENVDCKRCGCAVPTFMRFRPSIIKEGIRVLGGFANE